MARRPDETMTKLLEENPLMQFLGAEHVEEIKKGFVEILLRILDEDLRQSDRYIFDPNDMSEIAYDAYKKVRSKIQKKYENAMLEAAEKAVERWKEAALGDSKGNERGEEDE